MHFLHWSRFWVIVFSDSPDDIEITDDKYLFDDIQYPVSVLNASLAPLPLSLLCSDVSVCDTIDTINICAVSVSHPLRFHRTENEVTESANKVDFRQQSTQSIDLKPVQSKLNTDFSFDLPVIKSEKVQIQLEPSEFIFAPITIQQDGGRVLNVTDFTIFEFFLDTGKGRL